MSCFHRWPTWMWANTEIVRLGEWMRSHNSRVPRGRAAGFHGLDVYSLFESIGAVLDRLEKLNPFLARRARVRYGCFDSYWEDEWRYARSLIESANSCEKEVVEMLQDLLKVRLGGGDEQPEGFDEGIFDAQQNARVIVNAEHYYRNLVHGSEDSWNIRDRHMMDTLKVLLDRYGSGSKAIVWAHNTHIGDYRATDMLKHGQVNLGGLAREQLGEERVALVGFGTYRGTVTASHAWDGPIETMPVPDGKAGSWEDAFHRALGQRGIGQAWLPLGSDERHGLLSETRGHRAIGVVYDPRHERFGNYVPTSLSRRYDAFVFVDETHALTPLIQGFDRGEIPETYPVGQ